MADIKCFWAPQYNRDMEWSESSKGQERWLRDWSIWHLKRSLEPGLLSLERRNLLGSLINVSKYLMGTGWEDGSGIPSGRTRGNGPRNKHKKYHLNKRKVFLWWEWSGTGPGCLGSLGCTWPWENCSGWTRLELDVQGSLPPSALLGSAV